MSNANLTPTLNLACELISRPSVTPEDMGCQALLSSHLEAAGFTLHHLRFGEVENLWAVRGTEGPILAFAGHTDVVPTGEISEWHSQPFYPTLKGDMLYGRGAADMKGSLAAMVTACDRFVAQNPNHKGRIAFLITSDEEGIATHGTVKVIEWLEQQSLKITWCVVGEPSSNKYLGDTIKNGRRGSLNAVLTVRGKQGHVAYPQLAHNPIHAAAPALTELCSTHWDNGNDYFPATSFQISNINSGTGATNVIPSAAKVVFNFRFSTELTHDELQARTANILDKHGLDYELNWELSGLPFLTEKGDLVDAAVSAIKNITGRNTELSTSGGTSDGRFIAPTGAQVLELGPVNATIHQTNECVLAEDLNQLSDIYENILINLLVV
ncbi:MAG: succinyl-diaminopimelate desuccinylase [Lentisphaeria bacterium]|jgi:succinyl-diaminopimelate desuccinylase